MERWPGPILIWPPICTNGRPNGWPRPDLSSTRSAIGPNRASPAATMCTIWRNLPYLGLGAGAHGYAADTRYANVLLLQRLYCTHRIANPSRSLFRSRRRRMKSILSTLPEVDGGNDDDGTAPDPGRGGARRFRARFERDLWDVYGPELDRLIRDWAGNRLTQITASGSPGADGC